MVAARLALVALAVLAGSAAAGAATVTSGDGLAVTFSDDDGSVTAVTLGGTTLPLLAGQPGGLSVRVGQALPPAHVHGLDFDVVGGGWTAARNSDWEDAGPYTTWIPDGGSAGSGHLLLGDGATTGAGMAMVAPVPVAGGSTVRISWQAKAASTETTQILCLRLYDAAGADITPSLTPAAGWGWTSTSQAHAVWGQHCSEPDLWENFEQAYVVPSQAASIRVSLRHWTGGDHLVHIDDLSVDVIGGLQWDDWIPVAGPISQIPGGVRQTVDLAEMDLGLVVDTVEDGGHIRLDVHAETLTPGDDDLALLLCWTLPVDAQGWSWWDDIDTPRLIGTEEVLTHTFHIAGHAVSLYPFSSITSQDFGLALSVPMDETVVQRFEYDPQRGLQSVWELGLSPLTARLGPGQADVSASLCRHDAQWGFRSASQRYHNRYPEYFVKRTTREGAWMYPIPPSLIPDPQDFGFAFFETSPLDEAERELCAHLDIGIFHYTPRLVWQGWGDTPDRPPYDERVGVLEQWAANPASFAAREPSGGVDDSGHLLLGDGTSTGAGMATATTFDVTSAEVLEVSWQQKVSNVDTMQLLCLRVFDSSGADITPETPAPSGWFWSSGSQAHTVAWIQNTAADTWESFSYLYELAPEATAVRLSLRHWTGGDHLARIDDLRVGNTSDAVVYLLMPFEVEDDSWLSAHNADWEGTDATWLRGPRQQIAQAVINSSPLDSEGRYLIDLDSYFWHEWAADHWHQAWPVNHDPDLATPNTYDFFREYLVRYRIEETDGTYFDSVVARGGAGGWENHRAEHLACTDSPLTFSWADGAATQLAPQSHAEYLGPLAAELRAEGRVTMVNLFPRSTRYHAHDSDFMGSEVSELQEDNVWSRLRRTMAKHRIVSNLLQWGWDSPTYATYDQMEEFIRGQLFWGFYPAVSSAGGMLSGGTPDRYFLHPELYERDRPLFQLYMPVIRQLSTAGWEPITNASASPQAEIERFGDFSRGPVLLTVRGVDGAALTAEITIDLQACGLDDSLILAAAEDILSGEPLAPVMASGPKWACFDAALEAGEVGVFRFQSVLFADLDEDGDVDHDDLDVFTWCMAGPGGVAPPACVAADSDGDTDVDLRDFAVLQRAFGAATD